MFDPPRSEAGAALGVIELTSLARAFAVADAAAKRAPALIWLAEPISPGRFLLVLTGEVAEVDEAWRAGLKAGGERVLDSVLLPQVERQIPSLLRRGPAAVQALDALGIVETTTCTAAIRAADAALKCAETRLVHLHLGRGIGGKGLVAFTGALHDVQAALLESLYACREEFLVQTEEIAAPHAAMALKLLGASPAGPFY